MTPEMQRPGDHDPGSLHEIHAARDLDTTEVTAGECPHRCYRSSCIRPVVKALGTTYLCEVHWTAFAHPILRRLARVPDDALVGVGRFDAPAVEYPIGWTWLRCDLATCGATWIGKRLPEPLCPWCVRRIQAREVLA